MADHRMHFKLYARTAKGFSAEANFFGDDAKAIATDVAALVDSLRLSPDMQLPTQESNEAPQDTPQLDATVENAAKAFLANCEAHKSKWYLNKRDDRQWRSHKEGDGFCNFSHVAKAAWEQELKNLDWDEGAVKAYVERHFPKATHFGGLGEEDQARAIAILRIGKV